MRRRVANVLRRIAHRISPLPAAKPPEPPPKPTPQEIKEALIDNVFHSVKEFGLRPKHILDIGANCGDWTRHTLKHFPEAQYTLLEPNPLMKNRIQNLLDSNPRVKLFSVGASEQVGEFPFTITSRDDSCNFLLNAQQAAELGLQQIPVPVVTIDGLLQQHSLPSPEIIKIDAEGLDLSVLKGAVNALQTCELVFAEAAVMCKWKPAVFNNTVAALVAFMDTEGFTLFDITDVNRTQVHGNLWLIELAFVRKDGRIDKSVDRMF